VGDRSYRDNTMVGIMFLIYKGRYNQELILGVDLRKGLTTRHNVEYGL
jgi:hypothetical protein